MLSSNGVLDLSHNWLSEGWVTSHDSFGGSITDDGSNLDGTDPGFEDLGGQDFGLVDGADGVNAGTDLHADVLPEHQVLWHYVKHQASAPRPLELPLDLGAYERCVSGSCGAADAGVADSAVADTGEPDIGSSDVPDIGLSDIGLSDIGLSDIGLSDAGSSDIGSSDLGSSDLGSSDLGSSDLGSSDTERPDAGVSVTDAATVEAAVGVDAAADQERVATGCACRAAASATGISPALVSLLLLALRRARRRSDQ